MGNAAIFYYPDPDGPLVTLDLGEGLSDLQVSPMVDESTSESMRGNLYSVQYSARSMVRLVVERFTDAALARSLWAVQNHLRRGGSIAVAEDIDKARAAFAVTNPAAGATEITVKATPWDYNPSAAFVAGDELVIQSASPEYQYEISRFNSQRGLTYVLDDATLFDRTSDGWTLVRHRGFWPILRIPAAQRNQPILTHDHRISYTFDLMAEEHVGGLETFAALDVAVSTGGAFSGPTLEGIINTARDETAPARTLPRSTLR